MRKSSLQNRRDFLRKQRRKRGVREASAKREWRARGGALKNPACPHTIVQALPPPGTPFKNQLITALGKLWHETLSGATKSDHRR